MATRKKEPWGSRLKVGACWFMFDLDCVGLEQARGGHKLPRDLQVHCSIYWGRRRRTFNSQNYIWGKLKSGRKMFKTNWHNTKSEGHSWKLKKWCKITILQQQKREGRFQLAKHGVFQLGILWGSLFLLSEPAQQSGKEKHLEKLVRDTKKTEPAKKKTNVSMSISTFRVHTGVKGLVRGATGKG